MKISKKPKDTIKSCNDIPGTDVVGDSTEVAQAIVSDSPYTQAQDFIQSAIGALSIIAKDDPIAKDSIANLAVVLLDLQGC